jgi:hypothetical protein
MNCSKPLLLTRQNVFERGQQRKLEGNPAAPRHYCRRALQPVHDASVNNFKK